MAREPLELLFPVEGSVAEGDGVARLEAARLSDALAVDEAAIGGVEVEELGRAVVVDDDFGVPARCIVPLL